MPSAKLILSCMTLGLLAGCATSKEATLSNLENSPSDMAKYKTFSTMGKEQAVLTSTEETELFNDDGAGCLTHMWFGGAFDGVAQTRIRIYIDGETEPSIDMELYMGHGIGFGDEGVWGIGRVGKVGAPNSVYNTYRIPFGAGIRITAQLPSGVKQKPLFWWIIRGTRNLPVNIGGVQLPSSARLRLYKLENHTAKPLEEFDMCNVEGDGALHQVSMAAKGLRVSDNWHWHDISYMESCVRAYIDGADEPMMLSSGLEDYFLGTYYFNKGRYATPVAGLTHFNKRKNTFSAYRFHEDDPVFFQNGLRLTNRCGEKIGDKIFHNPPATEYTTYVWLYQW